MHTPGDPSKDALQPNPLWASRVLEALAAGEPLPRVLELLLSSVHAWCPDCGFALLLSEYPDNPKAPDALYKLGKVQFEKGNREKAREYLDLVVSQYSGANPDVARLAREFIAENY